ncbi:MAG: Nickel transport system permease protein NikB [Chloroflexi bacterium ADurb.Bin325]|nr:MAG: Nickel transport system permease protein NikB [Chloroflexi bacterium ADurb.Bin325]
MLQYIVRRVLMMIPTLFGISVVTFIIIQLPPGDFFTTYISNLAAMGESVDQTVVQAIKEEYGFDQPIYVQYGKWMWRIITRGDFGKSFQRGRPVTEVIGDRMALTVALSLFALVVTWVIAFPIGIYSAVRQYSFGDYLFTFLGFIGLAVPSFLIALVLMYVSFKYFNQSVGGLFSPEYVDAPWNLAKFKDLMSHLWIPTIIIALEGTAGLIRVMRANLLDELHKPYYTTAKAKGLSEFQALIQYPVRVALNPWISSVGWILPGLVSGATIISVVLSLPTTGPMQLQALLNQDMYLAGSFVLILSTLTVVGTLLSDILLAWVDPRIRYQ